MSSAENLALSPQQTDGFRIRLFSYTLLVVAIGIVITGGVLQWRLQNIAHQPPFIAQLASEKHLVNSIQEDTVALLNTNDGVLFSERLKNLGTNMAAWRTTHATLVQTIEDGNVPDPVGQTLARFVLPKFEQVSSSVEAVFSLLRSQNGNATIEDLKEPVQTVRRQTEEYLFQLDHLDLLHAELTGRTIKEIRWLEGMVIVTCGIILFAMTLLIFFPTQKTIKNLVEKLESSVAEIQKKNQHLETLRKLAHERLQVALDASKTGTYVWRKKDDTMEWDRNLAALYGLADNPAVRNAADFLKQVYPPDVQKVHDHIERTLANGVDTAEFRVVAEGKIRWIRDSAKITDRLQLTVVGASTDETDLMRQIEDAHKSKQIAMAASKVKTEFIANMSHDLRTPLSAIMGFAEIIKSSSTNLTADQHRRLQQIMKNGEIMLGYVEELLDVSRLDAGEGFTQTEIFSLRELLSDRQNSHRHAADEKGLIFATQIEAGTPDSFLGHRLIMAMVLDNLISNAVNYSDHGKILMKAFLKPHRMEDGKRLIEFQIADQGRGIAPERHSEVFEPFTPRAVTAGSIRSTGLGLYSARRLAALIGGTLLLAKSGVGEGSIFSFSAPVSEACDPPRKSHESGKPNLQVVG